jgi:hypothetical protein
VAYYDLRYLPKEVAMQIEVIESVSKTIGVLALAYPYPRRLGVAEPIDALVTAGQERMGPTGQDR